MVPTLTPCPSLPQPSGILESEVVDISTPTPCSSLPQPLFESSPVFDNNCTEVSVKSDATYCITGPVCSGAGETPAGDNCPKKGALAKKDCLENLKSYDEVTRTCLAPVDAQCWKLRSGTWGCVFNPDQVQESAQEVELPTPAHTLNVIKVVSYDSAEDSVPTESPIDSATTTSSSNITNFAAQEPFEKDQTSFNSAMIGGTVTVAGLIVAALAAIGYFIAKHNKKSDKYGNDAEDERQIHNVEILTPL
jgi:hypothetical protein